MRKTVGMNETTKKLLSRVQQGMPISSRPYRDLGQDLGLTEDEVIKRLGCLRKRGLLKRLDFSVDTRRLGLVSTLVACRIGRKNIPKAKRVLDGYGNITHNYLRKHRLNMWFTLSAASWKKLNETVSEIKSELAPQELVSLPTRKVYKLKFKLDVA